MAQLGEIKLTLNLFARCQSVDTSLKTAFPMLQEAGNYTLCTSNYKRHLERLSPPYSAMCIKDNTGQEKIFIIPLQTNLDMTPAELEEDEKVRRDY